MEPVTAECTKNKRQSIVVKFHQISTNGVGEVAFTRRMQGQMDDQTGATLNARRHFITGE